MRESVSAIWWECEVLVVHDSGVVGEAAVPEHLLEHSVMMSLGFNRAYGGGDSSLRAQSLRRLFSKSLGAVGPSSSTLLGLEYDLPAPRPGLSATAGKVDDPCP